MKKEMESNSPSDAAICSISTTFYIQEERSGEWIDYAPKDTAEIMIARLAELKAEKPARVFRGIIRVISDHLLPNVNVVAPPPLESEGVEIEKPKGGCPPTSCSFSSLKDYPLGLNQNTPSIAHMPDGSLVQLSPDNYKSLLGEKAEVIFYQGPIATPEEIRLTWDRSKLCSLQNSPYGKLMLQQELVGKL